MRQLRNLSARPTLLVDQHGRSVQDPTRRARVGLPGPFGRARVIFALPLNKSNPTQLTFAKVLRDADSHDISDPQGVLIGRPAVWVSRMLYARWVEDTRRIGG